LTRVAQQNTKPVTTAFCVPHIPPCVIYSYIPIGKRLERKMENETRGYIFAWSHSLIHYLKISVKRQKIESRIRGNSPKFNNIKLICFIFFYFIYGFERVWACLLCNVCLRSYIFLAQRQSVRLYLFHVPCIPIQSLAFLQPCVTV